MGTEAAVHLGTRVLSVAGQMRLAAGALGAGRYLGTAAGLLGLGGVVSFSGHRVQVGKRETELERRLRREMSAYLTLNLCPRQIGRSEFGRLMSRTIATRSSFARAAVLLRDADGNLCVAGSAGMDDLSVEALNRWGAQIAGGTGDGERAPAEEHAGAGSLAVQLERRLKPAERLGSLGCKHAYIMPMRAAAGVLGALVVCAEPRPSVRELSRGVPVQRLLEPIEALALSLTLQLGRLPRRAVRERLPVSQENLRRKHASAPEQQEPAGGSDSEQPLELPDAMVRPVVIIPGVEGMIASAARRGPLMGFPSTGVWQDMAEAGALSVIPGKGVR